MTHMTLLPAYGRDYKSRAEAVADWLADKDFEDASWDATGRFVNRPQVDDGTDVIIRFKRATQLVSFRKGSEPKPRKRGAGKPRPRFYSVTAFDTEGNPLIHPQRVQTKAEAIQRARGLSSRTPGEPGNLLGGDGAIETIVLGHRDPGKPTKVAQFRAALP